MSVSRHRLMLNTGATALGGLSWVLLLDKRVLIFDKALEFEKRASTMKIDFRPRKGQMKLDRR